MALHKQHEREKAELVKSKKAEVDEVSKVLSVKKRELKKVKSMDPDAMELETSLMKGSSQKEGCTIA